MPSLTKINLKRGFLRIALRVPILLYRARLGWLFSSHILMLTHIGRRSGRKRYVVLEVLQHEKETGVYYVAAAWGEKANWFCNIQKSPQVIINVGFHHFNAFAVRVPIDEAERRLFTYAKNFPFHFRVLTRVMLGKTLEPTQETCRQLVQELPVVAIQPVTSSKLSS